MQESAQFSIFVIFAGAALLATAALVARQAIIVAYIFLGVALGPSGFSVINDTGWLSEVGEFGIIFLLYLLGLNMVPRQLFSTLRESVEVVAFSCAGFAAATALICYLFDFTWVESLVIGGAAMFSSTILGLKLLPTTALHHQHMGDVIVGILLLQDIIAIVMLVVLRGQAAAKRLGWDIAIQLAGLPLLAGVAWLAERMVIEPLLRRFDRIHEYIFLLVIAWCLGMAEFAAMLGLSREIGAFVAGVALATSPIALFIADSLRPLRDFFLVLFFFTLGAGFRLDMLPQVWLPAVLVAGILLVGKPLLFRMVFIFEGEKPATAMEIGARLGHMSEFAFLIAVVAINAQVIGDRAASMLSVSTLLTIVISAYWIVARYPTPIAVSDRLRRD